MSERVDSPAAHLRDRSAIDHDRISRRALLRTAAGVALAVPLLESWPTFGPWSRLLSRADAAPPPKTPLRVVFVYVPNGVHQALWTPDKDGALSPTLQPLEPHKKELTILSGLALDGARAHQDGAGDHARAGGAFLTCAHPRKTDGADIECGISIDQVLAKTLGDGVPFPSVELGTESSAQSGNCDSGYSCAYGSNIAWSSPTSPLAKETNPRRAFERLFLDGEGLTPDKRAKRDKFRIALVDAVRDDSKRVRPKLGMADRKKLDEYLDSVRALEKRWAPSGKDRAARGPGLEPPPVGIPSDPGEHIRRLFDVVRFAFETDTTRVVTVMCGNEGTNRSYPTIGVPEGHHDLSHHGKDAQKLSQIAKINRFHVEQVAYLAAQLKSVKEGKGTLLDNTLVVFGSGIGDGDAHNHDDLPIVLLGGAGGAVATGRHLKFKRDTPLANLYYWLALRAGVKTDRFGDSREPLANLGR